MTGAGTTDARVAYFDHAATTPMRPEALEVLLRVQRDTYGNPSGAHLLARRARRVLEDAREVMAAALGAEPREVVFTAGGTEADNLAIFGCEPGGVEICTAIEHHAVLHPIEHRGGRTVGVDARGVVDLDALATMLDDAAARDERVSLVSVMLANNESGVVQPLDRVAAMVRDRAPHAVLHTDAVQAFPWLDVATLARDAQLIAVSAHKFGGPKGVGALVVRGGVSLHPMLLGGGQEHELRSGTQNVAGIAAMAAAAEVCIATRADTVARVAALRDRLAEGLRAGIDGVHESGVPEHDRTHKVAGSCHLCFEQVESEALLFLLERAGVYASAASSCASGAQEPSHVLAAMGVPRDLAQGSLRLSLGWSSTDADVDLALDAVPAGVAQLRRMAGALA
jgi:cysteine desulfurase